MASPACGENEAKKSVELFILFSNPKTIVARTFCDGRGTRKGSSGEI
jgi:hypothetical protein